MKNHLQNETSPYLLQHAENPVNWYPWGEAAFAKARAEDKPVFLSIGYSTCHWCHVMAHESFEDPAVAALLNAHFVSIKVDKEERPDIDSIYMSVCQALTGSGGWPTSIFMTPEQKPFFAGTYFPKTARYGSAGFLQLLQMIADKWQSDRQSLTDSAEGILAFLEQTETAQATADARLLDDALTWFRQSFDANYGGFGGAPKFPTPHNLLFLMTDAEKTGDEAALTMAETTLRQMYRGGMFDHIGGGFSRYSTDRMFLVPHFEKMLYDNALLILAYCKAYAMTGKPLYLHVAEKTAAYVLREMTSPDGGFYSAQDADSDGEEGKYYVFTPDELTRLLGEEQGRAFNAYYDITARGNFEGKSIPNLLKNTDMTGEFDAVLPKVYDYRRSRTRLHLDDKILTSWNALMIAALAWLYRVSGKREYRDAAERAQRLLDTALSDGDTLFVSYRAGKRGAHGFLDDYAFSAFAQLALYEATYRRAYLERAERLCERMFRDFADAEHGGFYLYGQDDERLILRPKETYDGALPSGNAVLAYVLVRLHLLTGEERFSGQARRQLDFLAGAAERAPAGYCMFLTALSDFLEPPETVKVVPAPGDALEDLPCRVPLSAAVTVLEQPTAAHPLKNGKTTYYICKNHSCQPPVNELVH